jgi:hypothetical protein
MTAYSLVIGTGRGGLELFRPAVFHRAGLLPAGIFFRSPKLNLTRSKVRHYLDGVNKTVTILRDCGIQPTPQRIAVVQFILRGGSHPSADQVLEQVRKQCPTVAGGMCGVPREIVERQLLDFAKADKAYAAGVKKALG